MRTPFYGGFGLVAADNIPKPSLNVFRALHKLGTRRIHLDSDSALATTGANGRLALALWDYAPPDGTGPKYTMPAGPAGPSKVFTLTLEHVRANAAVEIWRVDDDHGNVIKAFNAMGRPPGDLTQQQITEITHRRSNGGTRACPSQSRAARSHRSSARYWPSSWWSDNSSNECDEPSTRSETVSSQRRVAVADEAGACARDTDWANRVRCIQAHARRCRIP